ncbi:MAG: YfhO family protein [Clostridia bacterium]
MERSNGTGSILTAGKKYRKSYTAFLLTACFLIPAIIMLVTYACYGMAPFGENSVLIMDMSNQYCEFYCGLKHMGRMGDLFFSWSKALGGNYIGVFAYYLSSPLSILTLLCPNAEMPICLLYLTCLKIGLCGLTFGIFLNKRHKRNGCGLSRVYIVLFSICYAMMSYNIVYSLSLMWLDAVIWLPLLILGTETLVHENRGGLLLFSFAGIFISTYYLSYMAGIFTCIYLLYAIGGRRDLNTKGIFRILLKFAGSAAGAAAIGAWLLVPTFFSLLQGKIGGENYQNNNFTNYNLLELFKKLVIGTYDGIIIRVTPFLYCGMIVFIFFFAFFFLKSINRERKIGIALIFGFLIMSTFLLQVDKAWHIFQLPNWFPYRYAFVISFIMVLTAANAFIHYREISRLYYGVFALLMMSVYIVFFLEPQPGISKQQIRYSVVFLILAMVLVMLLKYIPASVKLGKLRLRTRAVRGAVWVLLLCVTSAELSVHADYLLHGLDNEHGFESYDGYYQYKKRMEALVKIAEEDDANTGGSGFYRVVQGFQRNYNGESEWGIRVFPITARPITAISILSSINSASPRFISGVPIPVLR